MQDVILMITVLAAFAFGFYIMKLLVSRYFFDQML